MSRTLLITAAENSGERLDKLIAGADETLTRSAVQNLIEAGAVLLNGRIASKSAVPKEGDEIRVEIPDPTGIDAQPEEIPLEIVYEDEWLLVVNKPKGMVVHPAPGNERGTLVNALLAHCGNSLSGINGKIRPGIVHRIDKDTSGLLIVAKNDEAHQSLALQIKEHSFTRVYEAVVIGNLKEDTGSVDAPIGRDPNDRKRMKVTEKNSRSAVTHYEVLERFGDFTHLRLRLETGRTHQIRVHMASIGHPVAGDPVYGPKKVIESLGGQCLHARVIGFVHPKTGEYLEFSSELPDYFRSFLEKLRNRNS